MTHNIESLKKEGTIFAKKHGFLRVTFYIDRHTLLNISILQQDISIMTESNETLPPRFAMKGQYIKDLSLENPHAPMSLLALKEPPKVDLNLDLQAQRIQDDLYELALVVNIKTSAEKTLFIVDLTYAGIFELINIPAPLLERVLLVDCAFTLFPFARRVISDITRDGGFPPLLLEPIDFMGLFDQRKLQEPAEGNA
jgi:preprotein translocase subunit SecB